MKPIIVEIEIPEDTRRMIVACRDKAGMGNAIARTMDRENEITVRRIRQKLTGEVLNVRTGTLRRSIGRTRAIVNGDEIQSTVGSGAGFGAASVSYAAFWDFGYTGTEMVRAHVRRRLTGGFSNVKSHARQVAQAPRSFLGSTVADRAPEYGTSILVTALKFAGGDHE